MAVIIDCNSFSTAFIFALTPWVDHVGIKYVLVTILLISYAILSLFAVFIRWGKTFRGYSATRSEMYEKSRYKERD